MQLLKTVAVAALFAGSSLAAPSGSHVIHEKRGDLGSAWVKREAAPRDMIVPVRVGMRQSNLDKGHDMLMEVSRHDSPKYGHYYSPEQIHDLFAPAEDTVSAIKEWLVDAGIHPAKISQSVNKQWMQFDAAVSDVEDLLKAKFHIFQHSDNGGHNIACDEYSVPSHIKHHIDYITPGIKLHSLTGKSGKDFTQEELLSKHGEIEKRTFGVTNPKSGKLPPIKSPLPGSLTGLLDLAFDALCNVAITPACIRTMYKIPLGDKKAKGNELGIFEDLGDVYSQTDLNEFFLTLDQRIPQGTHPELRAVDGAVAPNPVTSAGGESDLDFQISYPVIWPQGSVLYQTDDPVYEANYTFEGFLNNFLDAIDGSYCAKDNEQPDLDPPYPDPSNQPGAFKGQKQCGVYKPTNVISISYGGQEADLPASYQQRQCAEFMKLGMQGVSVVISSGDSGVAGPAGDGSANGCLNGGKVFSPDFPASCPYITALGATFLPPTGNVFQDGEVAVTRFPSGGGFSNIYPQPDYQKQAVQTYLTQHKPPYPSYQTTDGTGIGANGGIYNSIGRGYPDFAAVGDNVVIFTMGAPTLIGGTSASAPVFAAILTRINEERIAKGKGPVGFVNPILYQHPEVLHDITTGNNPGCNTTGFATAPGWDPVTGLGTPQYDKMLSLFLAQP